MCGVFLVRVTSCLVGLIAGSARARSCLPRLPSRATRARVLPRQPDREKSGAAIGTGANLQLLGITRKIRSADLNCRLSQLPFEVPLESNADTSYTRMNTVRDTRLHVWKYEHLATSVGFQQPVGVYDVVEREATGDVADDSRAFRG